MKTQQINIRMSDKQVSKLEELLVAAKRKHGSKVTKSQLILIALYEKGLIDGVFDAGIKDYVEFVYDEGGSE